jgi:hypothetical protein
LAYWLKGIVMQNHWLGTAQSRQLMKEIDDVALDIWSQDGTLGDLFSALNDDHTDLLFSMKIKDFASDPNDMSCGIELVSP